MSRIRRGGFLFVFWVGDHSPRHVHVFKDNRELGKWNLEENCVMKGRLSKQIRKIIKQLQQEGEL